MENNDIINNNVLYRDNGDILIKKTTSQKAFCLRQDGNKFFKNSDFLSAINCYSKSIASEPNHLTFSNRAICYIKIKKSILCLHILFNQLLKVRFLFTYNF